MADDIPEELLKNGDKYDFQEAIENYGFDFESFAEKNFEKFIESTFITDFISFRRGYLTRDFIQVRFYAHKFKGVFKLMLSKDINENCEKMQFEIQRGNIHVDKLYLSIVKNMLDFLKEFIAFAEKINKPIYPELISKFWESNNMCNDYEDFELRNAITKQEIDLSDLTIDGKTSQQSVCCAGDQMCSIF